VSTKERVATDDRVTIRARMDNPATVVPGAMAALMALGQAAQSGEVPETTLNLVHLRASQINGCSFCVDMHAGQAKRAGDTDQRVISVAAWREAPYYTAAERAALALTEAVTRLSDRSDPVPDDVWNEAVTHYDPPALGALLLNIATVNLWNRLNVATRQIAGVWPA